MGEKKISAVKRMRIKNRLIKTATHEELAHRAMEAVTEFVAEAAPDRIDVSTLVNTRLQLEQLLRWHEKQGHITQADILHMEDDILLNIYNSKDEGI